MSNPYDIYSENAEHRQFDAEQRMFGINPHMPRPSGFQPFQGQPVSRPATFDLSRDSSGQPYFTEGGFRQFRLTMIVMIFGMLGGMAGYNAYHKRGLSKVQATAHGVWCAFRWKVWAWTAFQVTAITVVCLPIIYWQFQGLTYANGVHRDLDPSFTIVFLILNLATFVPAVGVTYCQMIDESLFRKRLAYRLLLPAYRAIGGVPWFVLHMFSLLPFIAAALKYSI